MVVNVYGRWIDFGVPKELERIWEGMQTWQKVPQDCPKKWQPDF